MIDYLEIGMKLKHPHMPATSAEVVEELEDGVWKLHWEDGSVGRWTLRKLRIHKMQIIFRPCSL